MRIVDHNFEEKGRSALAERKGGVDRSIDLAVAA